MASRYAPNRERTSAGADTVFVRRVSDTGESCSGDLRQTQADNVRAALDPREYHHFQRLLQQPTAPFREERVVGEVVRQLTAADIPHFSDEHGNLIVGVGSPRAYRARLRTADSEPVRLFLAHMDHPGFHGVRWLDDRTLQVGWLGGAPVKHLRGSRVWLADNNGEVGEAKVLHAQLTESGRTIASAEIRCSDNALRQQVRNARNLYGGFAFRSPVWRRGKRVYARVADDLAGVHVIVELARRLRRRTAASSFVGLLTRGEEVGFVGAVRHLESGWFDRVRRPVVAVSLETSRTLAGAVIGRGPVVRLGDRRTVFSPGPLQVVSKLAEKHLPDRHQRRIMDGGACEASATTAWGLPTVGLSIPLGNYHNQGFEGGPDCRGAAGPAPEFVHLDDVAGMLALCGAMMRKGLRWDNPWQETRRELLRNAAGYAKLLKLQ